LLSRRVLHGLQVLDDVDDVAAALGQHPADPGQLRDGLPQLVAVSVERVGGAVDEPADRRGGYAPFGPRSVASRITWFLSPLDRHRGAVDRNHRTAGHLRAAAPVGRGQLDIAGGDQVLGHDDRLGVGGDRHATVDAHRDPGLGAVGSIELILPTFTPDTRTSSPA
jgi:hypothetical protein